MSDDLDAVLIGGPERRTVTIVDYCDDWPARFEELASRVREALGPQALRIEHIGSTAVPGLAAKPIIDLLVVVEDVEAEGGYLTALESAGFELRVREPGHRMLRTPARDVHVHLYPPDSVEIEAYVALRDRLRSDPGDRGLYATTKRRLAERDWADMNHYAEAKTEVIQQILSRARR